MIELTILSPDGRVLRRLELTGERSIRIGRAKGCDVRLAHPMISREHAEIGPNREGQWRIRDLGSTHGTIVNAARIREMLITPGLEVRIGPIRLQFDNLASRIGAELDRLLDEDESRSGKVDVEIVGLSRTKSAPMDETIVHDA
ncbi:MAG: FHA domain-containing protein [Phycisphaeraceae bacterium]|nr:MAG: FHA domain-containing protein [Phycisphaeraceae bacterium]